MGEDTAKMKLLGFVLLLTFLVSTLGAPLVREELEETQWQAQDVLALDESLKDMSENGIKDLWEKIKKVLKVLGKYFEHLMDDSEKDLETIAAKLFADLGNMTNEVLQKIDELEKKLGPTKAVPEILNLIKAFQGQVVQELMNRGKDVLHEGQK